MNRATYNITNDRLKVWFAERLPREEYERAKSIGFVYWFGSKCLTCTWRPAAEDFIRAHGIEIEEDDQPDDTEGRADRFQKYADKAETHANGAQSYLEERANTARRRENASNAVQRELSKAEYWNRRIEAAIRHASFKERADVIARRIEGLETDLRKQIASITPHEASPGVIFRSGTQVVVGPKGRGAFAIDESELPTRKAWAQRWIDHIEDRLLYERAALAAAGGIQADMASPGGVTIEVGGAVVTTHWAARGSSWVEVTKVNPSTVEIFVPHDQFCRFHKIDRTRITDIASKLRVDSGGILIGERAPKLEKPSKATKNSQGHPLEKFGAFGSSSSFYDVESKPVDRWYLITKVNAKTLEYLSVYTEEILQAGGGTKPRTVYGLKKQDIYGMGRAISAATVKAKHPELLEQFAKFQELKKKQAERMAAKEVQPTQNSAA